MPPDVAANGGDIPDVAISLRGGGTRGLPPRPPTAQATVDLPDPQAGLESLARTGPHVCRSGLELRLRPMRGSRRAREIFHECRDGLGRAALDGPDDKQVEAPTFLRGVPLRITEVGRYA